MQDNSLDSFRGYLAPITERYRWEHLECQDVVHYLCHALCTRSCACCGCTSETVSEIVLLALKGCFMPI